MPSGEITDAAGIGINAMLAAVMLILIVIFSLYAKGWYRDRDDYEYSKAVVQEAADTYKFEMVGEATGDDIVEFILTYGFKYNYKIYTASNYKRNGVSISLTALRAHSASKNETLEDTVKEWLSEDYLTSLFGNDLYENYKIYTVKTDDGLATLGYVCVQYDSHYVHLETGEYGLVGEIDGTDMNTKIQNEIESTLRKSFEDNVADDAEDGE